jgi:hypothetical protein
MHNVHEAHLEVLQLLLVCCNGSDQPVSLVFELRPLLPYNFTQQLVLKALRTSRQNDPASDNSIDQ